MLNPTNLFLSQKVLGEDDDSQSSTSATAEQQTQSPRGHGVDLSSVAEIDNAERIKYLRIIDDLREMGVNESVSLPQLVVAGDQSSGKSSLLEGLTNIPFPVAGGLCTRFATQLVLKRCDVPERTAKITIIPGPSSSTDEERKAHIKTFCLTFRGEEITPAAIDDIFLDASAHMGLPFANVNGNSDERSKSSSDDYIPVSGRRFTDDILKIEIQDRNGNDLTVVDLPGLFHNPLATQTKEDKKLVQGLVSRYISEPRTIIIGVMSATGQLAGQAIFEMARKVDPKGARTVGVLTKCDVVQDGDEIAVLNIAQNREPRSNHVWYAVKNRSTKEVEAGVTIEQRHKNEEEFFKRAPWDVLARDNRAGVAALKRFLGSLLHEHIKRELPAVLVEMEQHLKTTKDTLKDLGGPRQTPLEQRQYLMSIATKYENHVENSLGGRYAVEVPVDHPYRLRTRLVSAKSQFANFMRYYGHTHVFKTTDNEADPHYDVALPEGVPEFMEKVRKEGDIYHWIRQTYDTSRGTELPGMVNPSLVEELFKQQSMAWKYWSESYFKCVCKILDSYNTAIFKELIGEAKIRQRLHAHLAPNAGATIEQARAAHAALLADEQGILQTTNADFNTKLVQARRDRMQRRLVQYCSRDKLQTLELHQALEACSLSAEDQAMNDIHDVLKAYYQIAVGRFQDALIIPVVERHLLGKSGPVRTLNAEFVGRLSDQDLAEIAGETDESARLRTTLTHKRDTLKRALEEARKI